MHEKPLPTEVITQWASVKLCLLAGKNRNEPNHLHAHLDSRLDPQKNHAITFGTALSGAEIRRSYLSMLSCN